MCANHLSLCINYTNPHSELFLLSACLYLFDLLNFYNLQRIYKVLKKFHVTVMEMMGNIDLTLEWQSQDSRRGHRLPLRFETFVYMCICISHGHSQKSQIGKQLGGQNAKTKKNSGSCDLFVYVCMCMNQCIRLTLSILFAFYFTYNISTCYLNEAQVVTESSR